MMKQLPLAIHLKDSATLADFNWENNPLLEQQIADTLAFSGERFLYLWGNPGCGKSQLLQACCFTLDMGQTASYLPLSLLKPWGVDAIEGLDEQTLLCLDDIHCIAGDSAWEEALFHLYNRIKDNPASLLIITANQPPAQSGIQMPDLKSRLSACLVIQMHELSDQQKLHMLIERANHRGFEIPGHVSQFILNHCSRNMHDLADLLNTLDEASLAAQRKITIPFVKALLNL